MNQREMVAVLMAGREYGGQRVEVFERRTRLFEELVACFDAYGIRGVGMIQRRTLVVHRVGRPDDLWRLSDNDGEVNLARVNDVESLRSMPYYTDAGALLDGATMAYRVRAVLDGEEVDFGLRHTGALAEILRANAPTAPAQPGREAVEERLREREAELAAMGEESFECEDVERRVALRAAIAELSWVLGKPTTGGAA